MNKKHCIGEGADSNLTPNSSKNIFKPLIASSLALALGVSVISAVELSIPNTPTATVPEWGFIWNGVTNTNIGGGVTAVYQPYLSSSTALEDLTFKFKEDASGTPSGTDYTATTQDLDITISDGGSDGNGGRAIQMGSAGDGNTYD